MKLRFRIHTKIYLKLNRGSFFSEYQIIGVDRHKPSIIVEITNDRRYLKQTVINTIVHFSVCDLPVIFQRAGFSNASKISLFPQRNIFFKYLSSSSDRCFFVNLWNFTTGLKKMSTKKNKNLIDAKFVVGKFNDGLRFLPDLTRAKIICVVLNRSKKN